MVNIIIYLEQTINAQHLVEDLLKEQLFANVTIDKENVSYKIENGEIVTTIKTVITAQTKSLLFTQIDNFIKEKYGAHIPHLAQAIAKRCLCVHYLSYQYYI